jgi:hypothetical protein
VLAVVSCHGLFDNRIEISLADTSDPAAIRHEAAVVVASLHQEAENVRARWFVAAPSLNELDFAAIPRTLAQTQAPSGLGIHVSAAGICWRPSVACRTSALPPALLNRPPASSGASARGGQRSAFCCAPIRTSRAKRWWPGASWIKSHDQVARDSWLAEEIQIELKPAEAEAVRTGKPAWRFKDFIYATRESRSRTRRVIAKAEWTKGERNPHFIVTSLGR